MKKKTLISLAIILVFIIIIVFFASKLLIWNSPYYVRQDATNEIINVTTPLLATIEGSLSYPSEDIPPLVICAENTENEEEYCTFQMIRGSAYKYGYGYKLEVPKGKYFIYAKIDENAVFDAGDLADYKAYYSDFVTCGMEFDCPSHEPIMIEVQDGEIIQNASPTDWYNF